mgnify:CR=1 FL=1
MAIFGEVRLYSQAQTRQLAGLQFSIPLRVVHYGMYVLIRQCNRVHGQCMEIEGINAMQLWL